MPSPTAERALLSKQRAVALRRILEDCKELKNDASAFLTAREVAALRQAFHNVMGDTPVGEFNDLAVQCDNVLWQLEKDMHANTEAHTGDEDRVMKGADNWKFAKIPKRRRMQTLVVSFISFFTGMPFFLGLGLFLTFYSWYTMPFMLLYYVWIFAFPPQFPVKRKEWFVRSTMFKLFRDYFPVRLVVPKSVRKAITPNRNYLFCYHPHGVASFGVVPNFATEANNLREILPGIRVHVQTLALQFKVPFWRELLLWSGMGDASAATIRRTLKGPPGRSALLVVGGAEESLLSSPKTNKLTLSKRKGFVKIAMQCGSPLVPVYAFGETNVYGNYADGRPRVQAFLRKMQKTLGFAIPLIQGRGWFNYNFGPMPHRRQIICVVGPPLDVPKIENPSQAEIDRYHGLYCEALLKLYDENKLVYDVYCQQEASIVT